MTDLYTRRVRSEVELLLALAERNPGRISDVTTDGYTLALALHGPPALRVGTTPPCPVAIHDLRIDFPVHFPAVPMELFLSQPVIHPNIHPETGFVCLWNRHRVSNTVEHAMHKMVAMLAGNLHNAEPQHVMQPNALAALPIATEAMPLLGVQHDSLPPRGDAARRQRLQ